MICLPLSWAPRVSLAEAQAPCQFICCRGDGACTVRPVKIQYLSSREAPSPCLSSPGTQASYFVFLPARALVS